MVEKFLIKDAKKCHFNKQMEFKQEVKKKPKKDCSFSGETVKSIEDFELC
jgi:hypothetical protein